MLIKHQRALVFVCYFYILLQIPFLYFMHAHRFYYWFNGTLVAPKAEELANYFKSSFNIENPKLRALTEKPENLCKGSLNVYGDWFLRIYGMLLNPEKGKGKKGGQNISETLNQLEKDEYLKLDPGYFTLSNKCAENDLNKLKAAQRGVVALRQNKKAMPPSAFHDYIQATVIQTPEQELSKWKAKNNDQTTIALTRVDYAHILFTVVDIYQIFLALIMLKLDPCKVGILWIDAHPQSKLDPLWFTLFGEVHYAGELNASQFYADLIWISTAGRSPLISKNKQSDVPYLEQFRHFVLSKHGIKVREKRTVDCDQLNVLFIWRRDYVAHPRNPKGHVTRKIKNEEEILKFASQTLPGSNVTGVQLDAYPLRMQLELISETDILIGMHGAGLTYTLFLPKTAGVIEFFPKSDQNTQFEHKAKARSLHYTAWLNRKSSLNLPGDYTIIPTEVVGEKVKEIHRKICGRKTPAAKPSGKIHGKIKTTNNVRITVEAV